MRRAALLVVIAMALLANVAHAADPKKAAKPAPAPAAAPQPPPIEPKAIDLLKASSATLAAAKSMSFTAVVSYESPSAFGPPLVYSTKTTVLVQRPDKVRAITSADGPASEFYYDGATMTAFEPASNLAATAEYIGAERILWASDYPHPDIEFPGAVRELKENISTLSAGDQRRIAGENAIAAYKLPL